MFFDLKLFFMLIFLIVVPFASADTIGVIMAGTGASFLKIIQKGAQKAASELNIKVITRGQKVELNTDSQGKIIQAMVDWVVDINIGFTEPRCSLRCLR